MTTAKHYYEAHVTIEPVFDKDLTFVKAFASTHHFKLADLLMKKREVDTEERSSKDTFMTSHSKNLEEITERTKSVVKGLVASGFKVWRYKIEDTVLDSRIEDELHLL
jgi:hypothetical protein